MILVQIKPGGKASPIKLSSLAGGLQSPLFRKIFAFRMKLAAVTLVSEMKKTAPRDTGRLANSHGYAVDVEKLQAIVFNRAAYSVPVHEGRRPGKAPPSSALLEWARRKTVNSRLLNEKARFAAGVTLKPRLSKSATSDEQRAAKSLAFLVARAIGRRGIKPRPWFRDVIASIGQKTMTDAVTQAVEDFKDALGQALGDAFTQGFKVGPGTPT